MVITTASIHHWRFEDGIPRSIAGEHYGRQLTLDTLPRGWYCWVFPSDHREFKKWMDLNCPTADCVNRFNNGNPMWTVYIKEDKEASLFQLRWA